MTLGAVISVIAPFLHMLFPRSSTTPIFGFYNARKFFYALGMPITIFFSATILSFSSNFIESTIIAKFVGAISKVFLSIAFYYLIWTFTASNDWSPILYFISIIILSIIIGFLTNRFLQSMSSIPLKLYKAEKNVNELDKKVQRINHIAKIMPEDNEHLVTYKSMIDVSGENLEETVSKIKKDLENG